MRRSLGPLVVGFAAGVLCLAVFLALTGRVSLNRQETQQTSPLSSPLSSPDVTKVPAQPTNAASPAPPDASTFAHPPDLTPSDLTRPSRPASTAASPVPPDPSTFKPAAAASASHAATITDTSQSDIQALESKHLVMPIAGLKPADILDTFNQARGSGRKHEATDILSPRGTPVLAMDEGNVVKLFTSKLGGLTVYQFDNRGVYCYYYAHLDRYAENLKEGMLLRKGDKLGYVGSTGDADAKTPHLHLAINKLGPEKHWWQGTPLNPYPVLMHILGK